MTKNDMNRRLAVQIRYRLKKDRRTQAEIAQYIGANRSNFCHMLSGRGNFSVFQLQQIAEFFGLKLSSLLKECRI